MTCIRGVTSEMKLKPYLRMRLKLYLKRGPKLYLQLKNIPSYEGKTKPLHSSMRMKKTQDL
jgi:hypothetical protein